MRMRDERRLSVFTDMIDSCQMLRSSRVLRVDWLLAGTGGERIRGLLLQVGMSILIVMSITQTADPRDSKTEVTSCAECRHPTNHSLANFHVNSCWTCDS